MANLSLRQVWEQQRKYNTKVRASRPLSYEEWMEKYLLGAISEINEILNEMNWKAHRRGKPLDRVNLSRELADLTKYVLSMWEWSGYEPMDMLFRIAEKSHEMELQWQQDFEVAIPVGAPVVITDIDGTLADYRSGFVEWLRKYHHGELPEDKATTLAMEVDLGLSYPKYVKYKDEFESSGGYANIPIYPEVKDVLSSLHLAGFHILAYTARPAQTFSRIWNDTWQWLTYNQIGVYIRELRIGKETRIARACELRDLGHPVVLLEDEPDTALRAANAGIRVLLRQQPYNFGVLHDNIGRVNQFTARRIEVNLMEELQNVPHQP